MIDLTGGKCQICGYNKCLSALTFHHKDPNIKSFTLAKKMNSASKEKLIEEIKKCVLVCSNCHHEIHEGITSLRMS